MRTSARGYWVVTAGGPVGPFVSLAEARCWRDENEPGGRFAYGVGVIDYRPGELPTRALDLRYELPGWGLALGGRRRVTGAGRGRS